MFLSASKNTSIWNSSILAYPTPGIICFTVYISLVSVPNFPIYVTASPFGSVVTSLLSFSESVILYFEPTTFAPPKYAVSFIVNGTLGSISIFIVASFPFVEIL